MKAIKEAVKILEDFLEKFDSENRSSQNKAYLPSDLLEKLPKHKSKLINEFIEVYTAKKNYKMLRTLHPEKNSESKSWDIIRNRELKSLKSSADDKLFKDNGEPTDSHLEMIYWAYSPQPAKVKSFYEGASDKSASKRRSNEGAASSPAKKRR